MLEELIGGALLGASFLFMSKVLPLTSEAHLEAAERKLFSNLQTPCFERKVQCNSNHPIFGKKSFFIHHVEAINEKAPISVPVVLVHGWGGGKGIWIENIDALAQIFQVVYAGWGRSERVKFNGTNGEDAMNWWVEALEAWRKEMDIENMVLVGHSLGALASICFSLRYPERVLKLVTVAPPGIEKYHKIPKLHPYTLLHFYYKLTPQKIVRKAGILGKELTVAYMHYGDGIFEYHRTNERDFYDYMFHCSAAKGSGEFAFTKLTFLQDGQLFVYTIQDEIKYLTTPILIICGGKDFLLHQCNLLYHCANLRPEDKEFVVIPNSGHNVNLQSSSAFNQVLVSRLYNTFFLTQ